MAVMMRELLATTLDDLRYEPTAKRIRVSRNGHPVADTYNGLLVWEPRRIVPTYAIPAQDVSAELRPAAGGETYDIVVGGATVAGAAFRPDDPDLVNHVVLDFNSFDWREEDEPIVSHPHDPFKRIDLLRSSRQVRIEIDGQLLADSERPMLLFETLLPVRFYLPPEDITAQLEPSDTVTYCAYKGRASYFSLPGVRKDVAWTYHEPLHDALNIRDYICFFDERVDVVIDGQRRERPTTPWSD